MKKRAYNFIDLTGQKFDRLTVNSFSHNKKGAYWNVTCDCGKTFSVMGASLKKGATKSCGCLSLESRQLPKGTSGFNRLYKEYIRGAKERNLPFELDEESFKLLTKQNCHYCGVEPLNERVCFLKNRSNHQNKDHSKYVYNGIDRIDNNKGYTKDNVVACCTICNRAKHNLTYDVFKMYIERIRNFIK